MELAQEVQKLKTKNTQASFHAIFSGFFFYNLFIVFSLEETIEGSFKQITPLLLCAFSLHYPVASFIPPNSSMVAISLPYGPSTHMVSQTDKIRAMAFVCHF